MQTHRCAFEPYLTEWPMSLTRCLTRWRPVHLWLPGRTCPLTWAWHCTPLLHQVWSQRDLCRRRSHSATWWTRRQQSPAGSHVIIVSSMPLTRFIVRKSTQHITHTLWRWEQRCRDDVLWFTRWRPQLSSSSNVCVVALNMPPVCCWHVSLISKLLLTSSFFFHL